MEVWVTTACSKTDAALAALDSADATYDTKRCIDQPPTPEEMHDVLARLGAEPWEVARERESTEAGFAGLPRDADHRDDWVAALVAHPVAIQRPIILLDDGTAVVARDPETLERVLGQSS